MGIGPRIELWVPALTTSGGKGKQTWSVKDWIGYYVANKRPWTREATRWVAWREHVWLTVHDSLSTRSEASRKLLSSLPLCETGWEVLTEATFSSRSHADVENVHKGIVDALVQRRGKSSSGTGLFKSDKCMAGQFAAPMYDATRPGVLVTLIGPWT